MRDLDLTAVIQTEPTRTRYRLNWLRVGAFVFCAAFWFCMVWLGCKALGLTWG